MTAERYDVPALKRGLAILARFDRDNRVMTLGEIARRNALPRATAFRLVATLERAGCLVRDPAGQGFRLGPGVLALGFRYLAGLDLPEIARPALERLSEETGASAHLAIRDGTDIVYLCRVPGRSALASNIGVGSRLPAHASTMGRALLAALDREALVALYGNRALEALTDRTPTTLDALAALLARDRERGYVASRSFYEPGVASLAAPVRDAAGAVVAAISVVAPEHAVDAATLEGPVRDRVLAAASTISGWLGWAPPAVGAAAE